MVVHLRSQLYRQTLTEERSRDEFGEIAAAFDLDVARCRPLDPSVIPIPKIEEFKKQLGEAETEHHHHH